MMDRKKILEMLYSIEAQMDQKNMAGAQADLGLLIEWLNLDQQEMDALGKEIQHTDGGW